MEHEVAVRQRGFREVQARSAQNLELCQHVKLLAIPQVLEDKMQG